MKKILPIVMVLASLAGVAQVQQPANNDVYYVRRHSLFDLLPITHKDIVMLGNSLTDGAEWNELFNNPHVKNRGIVGDIIQGYIDRIDPILKGKPKKLFILGGVNDISHDVSGDSIGRAMEKLVVLVKQHCPKTKIYVQSMISFNNKVRMWKLLRDREHVVVEGNAALKAMCERQGVTYIDLYPIFVDSDGNLKAEYTNDGLHLSGEAYLKWRDALLPYIRK